MVRTKKHLGQHFLLDNQVAFNTAKLTQRNEVGKWLEVGPGTGKLTRPLLELGVNLHVIEVDWDSVAYLKENFENLPVHEEDFLKSDVKALMGGPFGVIGNFPYNISSQIVFKILQNVEMVPAFGGMFQLEVAKRLAAVPNNKTYGILSVLTQAFYDLTLEFAIPPSAFKPQPKVQSAVIYGHRHGREFNTDKALFFQVVKTAFQQRRKMLSNALGKFKLPEPDSEHHHLLKLRAENLSVEQFILLTNLIRERDGKFSNNKGI